MSGINFDAWLRRISIVFALGLWSLSIYFSAQGFGFQGGEMWIVAGYFLGAFVTLLEVILNRSGKQLPRTFIGLCILAYVYGISTNILGIFVGRGATQSIENFAISTTLGIVLEVAPEPLMMFGLSIRSNDIFDTLQSIFNRPQAQPPSRVIPLQHPPNRDPNSPGRQARRRQP